MLQLKNIKKDYVMASETVNALKGVSISFRKKEFVSILGASGCGKTTLLNIIGGLDKYTEGDLVIDGKSTKLFNDSDWDVYRNHRIGFIFQSYNLIPHQTVLENVELALTISGMSKEERVEKAKSALDRVGLRGRYYNKPNQLSGGQCQRVAIARALVNDPEILLADEPTGALDTQTSVQIMDLIKEISSERLVIMVTHNPELAKQYSTRIISLKDGNVIEDTNPMTDDEIGTEQREIDEKKRAEEEEILLCSQEERKKLLREKKRQREKAKMSFFQAFKLSSKNLISKKGRTILVGIAGSIGIIGIALVLAFSAGIKGYVVSMQDDMLSGNPIVIADVAYDLEAMTKMMSKEQKEEILKQPNYIYINSLIEFILSTNNNINNIVSKNELTEEYLQFIENMPKEYYSEILKSYGISLNPNLYTDFKIQKDGVSKSVSITHITNLYSQLMIDGGLKDLAYLVPSFIPNMAQAPKNTDYILNQYDILSGKIADGIDDDGKYEVMLVVNKDDELSDLLLARYGYYSQEEYMFMIKQMMKKASGLEYEPYKNAFSYEELLGKTFTYYPNDTVFKNVPPTEQNKSGYTYLPTSETFSKDGSCELKVVGILSKKDNVNYGSLTPGIYYTQELTDFVLETNKDSQIINFMNQEGNDSKFILPNAYGIPYAYSYTYDGEEKHSFSVVSYEVDNIMYGGMNMMDGYFGFGGEKGSTDKRDRLVRTLGGNSLANKILVYPKSFDDKDLVTDYLDLWNEKGNLDIGDKILTERERSNVVYTDSLELVITMINTIIDVISTALIAFTSISLVVSTVMIGIITYVSVVERIKEIGVIRSLGGRKKDVRHLFNAETFIIGFLAGTFGIIVTYILSLIINIILKPYIGYGSLASLPFAHALMLIALSVILTLISGLIPANSAAKKDPVVALRTE